MTWIATLGFPRIGRRRELKRAVEGYFAGRLTAAELADAAANLRAERWRLQQQLGVDLIPANDFSLYDHVLDTAVMVGAVPARFGWTGGPVGLDLYFEMARGGRVPPLEMTKWFDTNYHYLVPEFTPDQAFALTSRKPVDEFCEARALGIRTVPVLLGPVSFLLLGKMAGGGHPLALLSRLLPVYEEVLRQLHAAGAAWVQLDEPCLVLDRTAEEMAQVSAAYERLAAAAPVKVMLVTYFGGLGEHFERVWSLPVHGIHLDLVRAPEHWDDLARVRVPDERVVSLGVIDGRNVWRADLDAVLARVSPVLARFGGERVVLAPSCPLLHVPWDAAQEGKLDPKVRSWLSFAVQKLEELHLLRRALDEGEDGVREAWSAQRAALASRRAHPGVVRQDVRARVEAVAAEAPARAPRAVRRRLQKDRLGLPLLPTTTIGSFPQTEAVRRARADARQGRMAPEAYASFLREQIARCVRRQEALGLDVLVHGEFERTDMVEYFAEQLDGFLVTEHGWVQSYGTRCVKPPVIYGDVARPRPMTVAWTTYAQSLTDRPVKGMLTGPVTILQWSFVRDDLSREAVCRQIAVAIRDEVLDLERAGIRVIQIDEPALREGLPLRRADRALYLDWAVACFRLAYAGVRDETQIHTHMCYAEFSDITSAIAAMDVDVISLEAARSGMADLPSIAAARLSCDIGPGVYDIHSPRIPEVAEVRALLAKACTLLPPEQVWVNPDCGLKTRREEEVWPALTHMITAAREMRETLTQAARS